MTSLSKSIPRTSLVALLLGGCGDYVDYGSGQIGFEPERPPLGEPAPVEPYRGDNETVRLAQLRFPTGLDLHSKVIWRTCTPNGGVCHNRKEYPDLHTPANFVEAFSARCNIQPGEFSAVFDGCEQPGDRIRFSGFGFGDDEIEIGWVEYIPGVMEDYGDAEPPADAPGLHIHLATPMPNDDRVSAYGTVDFNRSFIDPSGELRQSTFTGYRSTWWLLGDDTHLLGRVENYQIAEVQELMSLGVIMGDANRNGRFGAQSGTLVSMLEPGDPLGSYLIGRMRGELHSEGIAVPGSRMPLANAPLTVEEMLALFCLVEGFPEGGGVSDLSGAIDYNQCTFSNNPEQLNLLGAGVTWESRVKRILEFNCGGCHQQSDPQGGLTLLGDDVYARLLDPSAQRPELALIEPGDPGRSYLFLKLTGDDQIEGNPMPYNPLTGEGSLHQAERSDIETWIINGAVQNE